MTLIFIYGPAAAGKLTVGRELQKQTGLRLFHNHLVVDTLLAVFPFGSDPFVRLREEMWLSVFREAAIADVSLIFTFSPESTVRPTFVEQAVKAVGDLGGEVRFVELICPIDELENRMGNASRAEFKKLRSVETFREIRAKNAHEFPPLPRDVQIDTSVFEPQASAQLIVDAFSLCSI